MPAHGKRRALGQHFLKNEKVIQTIVSKTSELAQKYQCRALLEIGPGKGAITYPLLKEISGIEEFLIAERDEAFINNWESELANNPALKREYLCRVLGGDFLDQPNDAFLKRTPLIVASNLPYSAGTAIVVRLAYHPESIPAMVLMFQAEVAERLRAEPSTKAWGSLSIWIQNRWDVKKLIAVSPGSFQPPPEVNSEVVVLEARQTPRIPMRPEDENHWESLLKVCFSHRRKMLRSGLPKSGPWQNALELSQVDGSKRSEALQWDEWQRLFEAYLKVKSGQ